MQFIVADEIYPIKRNERKTESFEAQIDKY